jgi:hypothetical protein
MSRRDTTKPGDDAVLEAYRAAACAEADAHFDDRALEAQRHKILARLAHLGQPARVIRFPKGTAGVRQAAGANRRWVSVAAAAGLIMGLLGGELMHLLPQPVRRAAPLATSAPVASPAVIPASVSLDDDLLDQIDMAVQLRGSAELRVLDELTPVFDPR